MTQKLTAVSCATTTSRHLAIGGLLGAALLGHRENLVAKYPGAATASGTGEPVHISQPLVFWTTLVFWTPSDRGDRVQPTDLLDDRFTYMYTSGPEESPLLESGLS